MDEERKFNLSVDIKEKKKSGTVLMTEGSIWKKLLIFSVPLILGNLLQQLYSTVDSIIVGNCVGKEALAAVGSTGSIVSLLIAFSQGASVGAGVIISQYMGAKRKDDVKRAVHTAMAIAVIIGLVLTVMGVFMSRLFLVWMQTPDNILDGASLYLQIYCGGLLFNVLYNMCAGIFNAAGNSKRPLLAHISFADLAYRFALCVFVFVTAHNHNIRCDFAVVRIMYKIKLIIIFFKFTFADIKVYTVIVCQSKLIHTVLYQFPCCSDRF